VCLFPIIYVAIFIYTCTHKIIVAILFSHFGCIASKTLNYLAFSSFDFERTWWMLI